jgi:hypothetical protein
MFVDVLRPQVARPRLGRQHGQETLQAILIFAFVLLPVIVSIFTFGSLIHLYIGEQAAAASGARSAGSAGGFGTNQAAAIDDALRSNDIDPATCSITASSGSVALDEPISITVSCPQHVGIPFLLERDVTISSTFVSRGEVNH